MKDISLSFDFPQTGSTINHNHRRIAQLKTTDTHTHTHNDLHIETQNTSDHTTLHPLHIACISTHTHTHTHTAREGKETERERFAYLYIKSKCGRLAISLKLSFDGFTKIAIPKSDNISHMISIILAV